MALQKQTVAAQMVTGLDTGKDPKLVSQGLLRLQNAIFPREGEIAKRYGFTTLTGAPAQPHMATYKEKPYLLDDNDVQVFDGSAYNSGGFDQVGTDLTLADVSVTRQETANQIDYGHIAESTTNVRVMAYVEYDPKTATGTYKVKSYDMTTGLELDSASFVSSCTAGIRAAYDGVRLWAFYVNSSDSKLYKVDVNTTTGVIGGASALTSGAGTIEGDFPFDVCRMDDADNSVFIAAVDTSGDVCLIKHQTDGTEATATASYTTAKAVGVCKMTTDVFCTVVYDEGTSPCELVATGYDSSLSGAVSAATLWTDASTSIVAVTAAATSATEIKCYYTEYTTGAGDGVNSYKVQTNTFTNTGGTGSAGSDTLFAMGLAICSKPFQESGSATHYIALFHPQVSNAQQGYVIVNSSGLIYARVLPGWGQGDVQHVAEVYLRDAPTYRLYLPHLSSNTTWGLSLISFSTTVDQLAPVETKDHLLIPSANPQIFDGQQTVEQGFCFYPWEIGSSTGSGSITTGTYGYKIVYEWFDALGYRHRSAPSAAISVDCDSSDVDLVLPTLGISGRSNVRIVIYRTYADGSVYYRLGDVANDPTAASVAYTDNTTDTALEAIAPEILYTDGSVLESVAPYSHEIACIHQNRICYVPELFSSTRVNYTKELRTLIAPEHNGALRVSVPSDGGNITAITSFMDRLVIFKGSQIYATHGNGYDDVGSGSGYAKPILISESVGCSNAKTIARLPQGLAFVFDDGIWILDKTLNVKPLGDEVRYLTDNATIRCAVVVPDLHLAVWFSNDNGAIVFDFLRGIWCQWTGCNAKDAVLSFDGQLYYKKHGANTAHVLNRSSYQDGGSSFSLLIETGWFSFAQLMGFMRVYNFRLVGTNISSHTLRIKTAYDLDPVWIDNQTFTSSGLSYETTADHYGAGLAAGYANQSYLLKAGTSRQKCNAIRLHISDESGTGASFSLAGIAFEIGLKRGLQRGQSARTAS